MHTGFWGTLAAYLPEPDVAISIAVTQQQSRELFPVFADVKTTKYTPGQWEALFDADELLAGQGGFAGGAPGGPEGENAELRPHFLCAERQRSAADSLGAPDVEETGARGAALAAGVGRPEQFEVVYSGMEVEASDGKVGKLDALVLDPDSGMITHILLREGHLWGKKDVAIPVAEIKYTDGESVYVKLDKAAVKALPEVPVKEPS